MKTGKNSNYGFLPFTDGKPIAAIQALAEVELRAAMRADSPRQKNVKRVAALAAAPQGAERRRCMTMGKSEADRTPSHLRH